MLKWSSVNLFLNIFAGFNFIPIQQFIPSKQTLTFTNTINTPNRNDDTGFVNGFGIQRFISLADVSGSLYGNIATSADAIFAKIESQNEIITANQNLSTETSLTFPWTDTKIYLKLK